MSMLPKPATDWPAAADDTFPHEAQERGAALSMTASLANLPVCRGAAPRKLSDPTDEARRAIPWHLLPAGALPLPGNGVSITESAKRIFKAMAVDPPAYFCRGGAVVELDPAGGVRALTEADFCSRIERFGNVVILKRHKDEKFWSPRECSHVEARLLLATLEARDLLPPLALVSNGPLLACDEAGRVRVLGKGYHRELGGVLVREGNLVEADLPTPAQAVAMLRDLLTDFRFLTPSDQSRALAVLIAPALQFGGHLVDPAPFHVGEADDSQSGKGYLCKLIGAIYGEILKTIAQSNGGVGSMDEDFRSALASGHPFILLDNLRGALDSPCLESFATSDRFQARAPYGRTMTVEPRRFFILATSNGLEGTRDLANRCSIVRIRKRRGTQAFFEWPEGDLLAHVWANRLRFLGCVFSVVRAWIDKGRPRLPGAVEHDRREWAGVLGWIVENVFEAAPLLDGHRAAQERVSNPAANWLRAAAVAVERVGLLGETLTASNLAELCEEEGVAFPAGRIVSDPKQAAITVGKLMGRLVREAESAGGDSIRTDAYRVTRGVKSEERDDGNGQREMKTYTFSREGKTPA